MVAVDVDNLTMILASRLAAIVPAGFGVEAADGVLLYSADEGRFPGQQGDFRVGTAGTTARANFGLHGETEVDHIAGVATQSLDELQDYVSEATHDPWPGTKAQPSPHARISGATLYLWYGPPDDVALACEPITLTGI
jgi:hypothetical protein